MDGGVLFYGDNLEILQEYFADASVDLVYLDPPFNSNQSYSAIFADESGRKPSALAPLTSLHEELSSQVL